MADAVLAVVGGESCLDISMTSLQSLTGALLLNGTDIEAIDPIITQALTGLMELHLNNNSLTQVPAAAFANLDESYGTASER